MKLLAYTCLHFYAVATALESQGGLRLGIECEYNGQCQSQHCVKFCEHTNNNKAVCIEASWFYKKHGLDLPSCIEENEYKKKIQYLYQRQLGETCHSDVNCGAPTKSSMRCIPECGDDNTIFRCSESLDYYRKKGMDAPNCVKMGNTNRKSSLGNPIIERKIQQTIGNKDELKKDGSSVAKTLRNVNEKEGSLRKEEQEVETKTKLDTKKVIPAIADKSTEKSNNPQQNESNVLTNKEDTGALDFDKEEAEALEKLKKIDMKVLELQKEVGDITEKTNNKQGTKLITAWYRSFKVYFGSMKSMFFNSH